MKLAGVRAVLFDLDGTLADTAPDLARALNRVRAERGLPPLPPEVARPHTSSGARGLLKAGFDIAPEDEGYRALVASNGKAALETMHGSEPRPALILLDLMMPVMDGWQFRAEQRYLTDKRQAAVPVLLMTGESEAARHADTQPLHIKAIAEEEDHP